MPSARDLILQHPHNLVDNPMYKSYTGKPWAREYAPLQKMSVHTSFDQTGLCHATFDTAFIPLYDNEEEKRGNEPAYPPNTRFWRLESESDIEHWWHAEVSDIVLSAWAQYPRMVETCHAKPLRLVNVPENVDSTYSVYIGNQRSPIAIGEIKRNLINDREWQAGILGAAQQKLASELRGYADKYECPQVFCWDGEFLLLLQFRAQTVDDIRNPDCPVDCWVIPAEGSMCTLRYALYRLLVQGFRRCQAAASFRAGPLQVGTLTETRREFFTGQPVWTVDGQSSLTHPEGYIRLADEATGGLYWGQPGAGDIFWETRSFWG